MKFLCFVTCIGLVVAAPAFGEQTNKEQPPSARKSAEKRVKSWFKRSKKEDIEKVKSEALKIPTGSPVSAVETDGTKVKGSLMKVANRGIAVKPKGDSTKTMAYEKIHSLKQIRGEKADEEGFVNTGKVNRSLSNIPEGAPVKVKLTDKSTIGGRYLGKAEKSVKLQSPDGGAMTNRSIPTSEIASIKENKGGLIIRPKLQPPDLVQKNVSGVALGSPLKVRMPDGKTVSGKLTGRADDGFTMQTLEGENIVDKTLPYDQVAGVKPVRAGIKEHIPGLQTPATQSEAKLKTTALSIPSGSPITLRSPDGTQTTGRLTGVSDKGVQIVTEKAGSVIDQNLSYAQVGTIKQGILPTPGQRVKRYGTAAALVVITGVVSGALAGIIK